MLDLAAPLGQRAALSGRRAAAAPRLDGAAAGAAFADIAETVLAALLPAVAADFARAHGAVPGGEFAVLGDGPARQPRDDRSPPTST